MANEPNTARSPLVEAVIDVKLLHNDDFDIAHVDPYYEQIKKDFPERVARASVTFEFGNQGPQPPQNGIDGYLFKNALGTRAILTGSEGFTLSAIDAYQGWEEFKKEFTKYFPLYLKTVKPIGVVRLGLRYIYRVDIPRPVTNLADYISGAPQYTDSIDHDSIKEMLSRVVVTRDQSTHYVITYAVDGQQITELSIPLIFDVDAIKSATAGTDILDFVKNNLDPLRKLKNDIFKENLTDKTKEMLKWI